MARVYEMVEEVEIIYCYIHAILARDIEIVLSQPSLFQPADTGAEVKMPAPGF
jgi:hypothetical protein